MNFTVNPPSLTKVAVTDPVYIYCWFVLVMVELSVDYSGKANNPICHGNVIVIDVIVAMHISNGGTNRLRVCLIEGHTCIHRPVHVIITLVQGHPVWIERNSLPL